MMTRDEQVLVLQELSRIKERLQEIRVELAIARMEAQFEGSGDERSDAE